MGKNQGNQEIFKKNCKNREKFSKLFEFSWFLWIKKNLRKTRKLIKIEKIWENKIRENQEKFS